ncbi:MAG: D-sedoheptulose 7-phosphate isomerase [Pseudomonadota bacterium]|jgi:D-sedoheptulose 7-phosphate isomerase
MKTTALAFQPKLQPANEVSAPTETESIEARMHAICLESIQAHRAMLNCLGSLAVIAERFEQAIRRGNKILLCGNGGSAADAQHIAGEMVGRFLRESDPWPVLALTTDSSILTCIANDWDYSQVFARQVRAFARAGDIVVGISTSGSSPNVLEALKAARAQGAECIGVTGSKASVAEIEGYCDVCFRAPSDHTPRIQELHILGWHSICEIVEERLLASD